MTRDTNDYFSLAVSADGNTAATVQVRTTPNLYVLVGNVFGHGSPQPLPTVSELSSFGWSEDGTLLLSNLHTLFRARGDGQNTATLLGDPEGLINDVAPCGHRYVVFSWAFHGDCKCLARERRWIKS